jgi:glycine cleavage system aminomethyltransferase T
LQTFYIPGQYDVRLEPHGQIIDDRLVLHFHSNEFVMIKH